MMRNGELPTSDAEALRRASTLATALGFPAGDAVVLRGGQINDTVRVGDVVVRTARAVREGVADPFDVEAWAARAAVRVGIRTPEVLARGEVDGVSTLVQHFESGRPASADDLGSWRAIGGFLAALARVDVSQAPDALFPRFGRDLDRIWQQHLDYNLGELVPGDPLIELGVYPRDRQGMLRGMIERLRDRTLQQGLVHGDLSTRNLLVDGQDHVLVDWGSAQVGPVPWTELELIRRWRDSGDLNTVVSDEAWAAVLDGAHLVDDEVDPLLDEVAVLHALDVVRWAHERAPSQLAYLASSSGATIARAVGNA